MCKNDWIVTCNYYYLCLIYSYTYVQNSSRTFVKRVSHALSSAAWRRRGERRRRRRFPHPSATCLPTTTTRRCCRGQISPGQGFFVAVPLVLLLLLLTLNPLTKVQNKLYIQINTNNIIQARDIIVCIKNCLCLSAILWEPCDHYRADPVQQCGRARQGYIF